MKQIVFISHLNHSLEFPLGMRKEPDKVHVLNGARM